MNNVWLLIYITSLYTAIEKENDEIVKLLLTNDKLDINIINISKYVFFNIILNEAFQWYSKWYISMEFKIK